MVDTSSCDLISSLCFVSNSLFSLCSKVCLSSEFQKSNEVFSGVGTINWTAYCGEYSCFALQIPTVCVLLNTLPELHLALALNSQLLLPRHHFDSCMIQAPPRQRHRMSRKRLQDQSLSEDMAFVLGNMCSAYFRRLKLRSKLIIFKRKLRDLFSVIFVEQTHRR